MCTRRSYASLLVISLLYLTVPIIAPSNSCWTDSTVSIDPWHDFEEDFFVNSSYIYLAQIIISCTPNSHIPKLRRIIVNIKVWHEITSTHTQPLVLFRSSNLMQKSWVTNTHTHIICFLKKILFQTYPPALILVMGPLLLCKALIIKLATRILFSGEILRENTLLFLVDIYSVTFITWSAFLISNAPPGCNVSKFGFAFSCTPALHAMDDLKSPAYQIKTC